jgi:protein AbiQ
VGVEKAVYPTGKWELKKFKPEHMLGLFRGFVMRLAFYNIDPGDCDFLRTFDDRVCVNNKDKAGRPFIGVVVKLNDVKYYAPLSSPKPKHLEMKSRVDFIKIDGGKLGVININNMIPVLDEQLIPVVINNANTDDSFYVGLLTDQITWCNEHKIEILSKAQGLYDKAATGRLNEYIYARCCDFKKLENIYLQYQQSKET